MWPETDILAGPKGGEVQMTLNDSLISSSKTEDTFHILVQPSDLSNQFYAWRKIYIVIVAKEIKKLRLIHFFSIFFTILNYSKSSFSKKYPFQKCHFF